MTTKKLENACRILDFSEKLGYTVELAKADAYNVLEIADKVNEIIQRNKNYSAVVNVSSGTRVMTIGALLAAYLNQSEVIYVPQMGVSNQLFSEF